VRLSNCDTQLFLVNVCKQCVSDENACEKFCSVISVITNVNELFPDALLILGGDFNVDFSRFSSRADSLVRFCSDFNMLSVINHPALDVDHTYNFSVSRFSTIDHFLLPKYVFDSSVEAVKVSHDVDNTSDHDPLFLQLNVCYAAHTAYVSRSTES